MKLLDIVPLAPVAGDYGIEVEVEGGNLPNLNNQTWVTHQDGSLRGESAEYVTNGPVKYEDVEKAINSLNRSFERKGSVLNLSFRTSVHVHMNVQKEELDKIVSIIYLYCLFEEPLMQFCGQERVGNRFCLRLRDCDGISDIIRDAFRENGGYLRAINANAVRYSSLNLASISRFGSLEFRGMRGTVDTNTIATWVSLLNCIKSSKFKTALETCSYLEEHGPADLANEVFGDWIRFIAFEGYEQEILRNASLAIMIPHTIKFQERAMKQPRKAMDVEHAIKIIDDILGNRPRAQVAANPARFIPDEDVEQEQHEEEEEF